MSIKNFVHNILEKLGLYEKNLENYLNVGETIAKNLLAVLQNPVVDGVLALVLPASIIAEIPVAEKVLVTAIEDLTIGSHIEADIKAATTPEEKVKIFLIDMQKYGITRRNMFMDKLVSLIIAGIDDKNLKEHLYDLYTQANYSAAKEGIEA